MGSPLRRRIRHARRFVGYGLLVVLILLYAAVVVTMRQKPSERRRAIELVK